MSRLKAVRNKHNLSQQEVADALGISLVTYNRLENGHTRLTTQRMDKLAEIYGVDPVEFVAATPTARTVEVVGRVCAGHWADSHQWDESGSGYSIAIPHDPKYQSMSLAAVETSGPSMNLRYPEGTVLVFTNVVETREEFQAGQRYIVERERLGGQRETTIKKLVIDDSGQPWLMPESSDPRHQEPIPLSGENGDTVRILGHVVYSVRRED